MAEAKHAKVFWFFFFKKEQKESASFLKKKKQKTFVHWGFGLLGNRLA